MNPIQKGPPLLLLLSGEGDFFLKKPKEVFMKTQETTRYQYLGESSIFSYDELSEDAREEFDEPRHQDSLFFEAAGRTYNLSDFMRPGYPGPSDAWYHGILFESTFSAIVIYLDERWADPIVKAYRIY